MSTVAQEELQQQVVRQKLRIAQIESILTQQKQVLDEMIKQLQDSCEHNWLERVEPNPNFYGAEARANGLLLGWECSKCLLFRPK